jgi:hypothetical protein
MTKRTLRSIVVLGALLLAALPAAAQTDSWPATYAGTPAPKMNGVPDVVRQKLANFDDLDFRVYTTQQWQDVHLTHSQDVVVHLPDGSFTEGLAQHIQYMKYVFTFAPDNRILEHPIRFATHEGEWTAVMSWLEGTFTQPMLLADGTSIAPTNKAYRIPMVTIGHWNATGVMDEEWLFWDNKELYKELGLGQ